LTNDLADFAPPRVVVAPVCPPPHGRADPHGRGLRGSAGQKPSMHIPQPPFSCGGAHIGRRE
jgi:hypothetical protein